MQPQTHFAIGRMLIAHTKALTSAGEAAVLGVYRRPARVYLRRLTGIEAHLATTEGPAAHTSALPGAVERIRDGRITEVTAGLCAVAFAGEVHFDRDGQSRIGTAVLVDGAVGHLTWEPDGSEPNWRLFPDATRAVDEWMIGLFTVLTALTGNSVKWGGAA
ncbi:hypothetical protein L0U85_03830 [Glycomyces sp. L485]|uniref:hypothetical protein n=1 Tax=Glycomyces sp. L485 TaxID=2909235 RepID=UPI001F4AE25C|nr:hypothetical protein [Glycomyces sp. L485]MCH7229992.1 hypothetical protein [Glycomyces sp. L485]